MSKVQGLHSTWIVSIRFMFLQRCIPQNKEVNDSRSLKAMGAAKILAITLFVAATDVCISAPKQHEATGGFLPSPSSYFLQSGDQIAMESKSSNQTVIQGRSEGKNDVIAEPSNDIGDRQQEPRFGFLTYGTTAIQNSGSTGLSGLNGQLKLDLGGVVLGAIIGFGAVFILPKILHVLSVGHDTTGFGGGGGSYGYRSEDEKKMGIMDILSRVDETLAQYNIDSSSCMQRAVCSYIKLTSEKVTDGSASSLDEVVDSAAANSVVNFLLDGTSIKQAVEMGRSGGNCGTTYSRCPFTKESLFAAIKGLMADEK